jgi:hypothetical protein
MTRATHATTLLTAREEKEANTTEGNEEREHEASTEHDQESCATASSMSFTNAFNAS